MGGGKFFRAGQIGFRKCQRCPGLVKLCLHRLNFSRAFSLFRIFEIGLGLGELAGGLVAGGGLQATFQGKESVAGFDRLASLDVQRLYLPGGGSGDIDEVTLDVPLRCFRSRAIAAGKNAHHRRAYVKQFGKNGIHWLDHDVTD